MHQIAIQGSDMRFSADEAETVLDAALRQGVILPYSCRNGTCGSCKGHIVSGRVAYPPTFELSAERQALADREVLLCQARPCGSLVLDVHVLAGVAGLPVKRLPVRVMAIDRVSDDAIVLKLKLPANERFDFVAGQYIDFLLKDGTRRSFSIGNAPDESGQLQLHVRRVPGGAFTGHVFDAMKVKDILRIEGPLGTFFLREDAPRPLVFIASGTGFAPVKAILEAIFLKGERRPITVYWGGRRPHDLYMHELVSRWADEERLHYVPVVSDARPEDHWKGRTGFVHRAVMEDFPDLSGFHVYACGVPVMVDSARKDLTQHCRLPANAFFADAFTTQAPAPTPPAVAG